MNGQAITVVTSASSLLGLRDAGHGGARHAGQGHGGQDAPALRISRNLFGWSKKVLIQRISHTLIFEVGFARKVES